MDLKVLAWAPAKSIYKGYKRLYEASMKKGIEGPTTRARAKFSEGIVHLQLGQIYFFMLLGLESRVTLMLYINMLLSQTYIFVLL